jgi:hypothetical protein
MRFFPAERTIILIILTVVLIDAALILHKGIIIGLDFFAFSVGFSVAFVALGQFYRRFRDSERIALTAHAVALFVAFTVFGALLNVVLLPRPSAPIDGVLVRVDAWFGYSWPALCAWFAQYPWLSEIVRGVYRLTLVQMLFVFMFLGLSLDRRRLHAACLAAIFAALITVFTWAVFPAAGPGGYWTLAPEIDRIVRPLGNSALGAEINRLLAEGVKDVATLNTTGLIGFPSFHTAMALISLIAIWPYRAARVAYVLMNTLLLPGILVHGGHHLMDMVAGTVVTLLSWRLALFLFDAQETNAHRLSSPDHGRPAAAT